MPATIFMTAFEQYAVNAFEMAAVDYLVKPFDDERFREALSRARRRLELETFERLQEQLLSILQRGPTGPAVVPEPATHRLERIAVPTRGRMRVFPVAEIDYITASGPYVELHVGKERHLVREAIQGLEAQLDPTELIRTHRSVIVRLRLIEAVVRVASGAYEVQLKNGTRLPVGRSRREALERRLGRV